MKLKEALKAMGQATKLIELEQASDTDTETDASQPSLSNSKDNIESTNIAGSSKAKSLKKIAAAATQPESFQGLLLPSPPTPLESISNINSINMKNKRKTHNLRRAEALRAAESETAKPDAADDDPVENKLAAQGNCVGESVTGDELLMTTQECLTENISGLKLAESSEDSTAEQATASVAGEKSSCFTSLPIESSPSVEVETETTKEEVPTGAQRAGCRKKWSKKSSKKKRKNLVDTSASSTSSVASVATLKQESSFHQAVSTNKLRFGFDDYRDELRCRKHGCAKMTNCYDGETVICPRCGLNSHLRYCSLPCLLDPDMRFHWAQECGQHPLREDTFDFDKITLITRPANTRPFIFSESYDNPARHRQAVHHSSNGLAGDYFIFDDFSRITTADGNISPVNAVGLGEIIAKVEIIPDYGLYRGKSIFHEILKDCLREGFMRPDKCLGLADIVTRELVNTGQWRKEVQDCLFFQMKNEFAYEIPQEILYRYDWLATGPNSA